VVQAAIPPYCWDVDSPPDYRERFATRLRHLRDAAELSLEKASEQGGLSTNFWGSVERMVQEPCLNSIFGFAKGLGISVRTLMTLEEENAQDQERMELNTLLDLLTPEQLHLALQVSRLIYKYKAASPSRSESELS
jgi:transcriptional regulator with XRE-family HTH domain